jgi:GAF domain-containing protein
VLEALDGARDEIARSALDLGAVMELICDTARELTGADMVAVDLVEGDELVTCAVSGDSAAHPGMRLDLARSLAGQCVLVGHEVRCGEVLHDPRVDFSIAAIMGMHCVVCVPLVHYGLPVGVLKAAAVEPWTLGDRETRMLGLLGELIVAHLSA